MIFCACSINLIWLGVGYFNRPGPEFAYHLYSEIGLKVAFLTALQNRKPQMPNPVRMAQSQEHECTKTEEEEEEVTS